MQKIRFLVQFLKYICFLSMFRAALSIILLIAFAIQTFHRGGIVVSYYLNKDAYSKDCVNKAKPVLKCNGKCQMAKKILEEQKKDEQAPERKLENKFQVIWLKSNFLSYSAKDNDLFRTFTAYLESPVPLVPVLAIFHPPRLV
jgi:hypothetical protein